MRFKSQIRNVNTFAKLTASLSSLGALAWTRLNDEDICFTVIPDKGSQVWSRLKIDTIFESYSIQSNNPLNTINLEVPIQALTRALKSAVGATSVQLRLTKKDNIPMLSLTITTTTFSTATNPNTSVAIPASTLVSGRDDEFGDFDFHTDDFSSTATSIPRERETLITQDIPVKVLTMASVDGLHEPRVQEPDVYIYFPPLAQIKSVSERFTRLALSTGATTNTTAPKLALSANMHGTLTLGLKTDALAIASTWAGLVHPELNAAQVEGGEEGVRTHPSTKMREQGPEAFARVLIDGKDFGRVLSVGRLGVRVIASFMHETCLVLFVYIADEEDGEESCLTYYVGGFSS